jgi:hypothetical protein
VTKAGTKTLKETSLASCGLGEFDILINKAKSAGCE